MVGGEGGISFADPATIMVPVINVAERVGFEPTVSLHPRRFSRPLP